VFSGFSKLIKKIS